MESSLLGKSYFLLQNRVERNVAKHLMGSLPPIGVVLAMPGMVRYYSQYCL
jgi:hypothetical protein